MEERLHSGYILKVTGGMQIEDERYGWESRDPTFVLIRLDVLLETTLTQMKYGMGKLRLRIKTCLN